MEKKVDVCSKIDAKVVKLVQLLTKKGEEMKDDYRRFGESEAGIWSIDRKQFLTIERDIDKLSLTRKRQSATTDDLVTAHSHNETNGRNQRAGLGRGFSKRNGNFDPAIGGESESLVEVVARSTDYQPPHRHERDRDRPNVVASSIDHDSHRRSHFIDGSSPPFVAARSTYYSSRDRQHTHPDSRPTVVASTSSADWGDRVMRSHFGDRADSPEFIIASSTGASQQPRDRPQQAQQPRQVSRPTVVAGTDREMGSHFGGRASPEFVIASSTTNYGASQPWEQPHLVSRPTAVASGSTNWDQRREKRSEFVYQGDSPEFVVAKSTGAFQPRERPQQPHQVSRDERRKRSEYVYQADSPPPERWTDYDYESENQHVNPYWGGSPPPWPIDWNVHQRKMPRPTPPAVAEKKTVAKPSNNATMIDVPLRDDVYRSYSQVVTSNFDHSGGFEEWHERNPNLYHNLKTATSDFNLTALELANEFVLMQGRVVENGGHDLPGNVVVADDDTAYMLDERDGNISQYVKRDDGVLVFSRVFPLPSSIKTEGVRYAMTRDAFYVYIVAIRAISDRLKIFKMRINQIPGIETFPSERCGDIQWRCDSESFFVDRQRPFLLSVENDRIYILQSCNDGMQLFFLVLDANSFSCLETRVYNGPVPYEVCKLRLDGSVFRNVFILHGKVFFIHEQGVVHANLIHGINICEFVNEDEYTSQKIIGTDDDSMQFPFRLRQISVCGDVLVLHIEKKTDSETTWFVRFCHFGFAPQPSSSRFFNLKRVDQANTPTINHLLQMTRGRYAQSHNYLVYCNKSLFKVLKL